MRSRADTISSWPTGSERLAGREVGDGAEAQQGLLVRQRDAAVDDEAGGGVLGVDRVVAGVRLDDDLGRRGVAEAEVHDRAEDLRGQAAHRRVGRRDEHVHAELAGGDPVVRGEHGVRRVVRLGQEGRDAVDPTQPGVVVLVGVDLVEGRPGLLRGVPLHAPEGRLGVGDPVVQHVGVLGGEDRLERHAADGREQGEGGHRATTSARTGSTTGESISPTPKCWKAIRSSTG